MFLTAGMAFHAAVFVTTYSLMTAIRELPRQAALAFSRSRCSGCCKAAYLLGSFVFARFAMSNSFEMIVYTNLKYLWSNGKHALTTNL